MFSFFKTIFKNIIIIIGCLLIFCSTGFAEKLAMETGIIAAEYLNIRSGPGRSHASIGRVKKGTRVKIVKDLSAYLKISYKGMVGYVRNREKYITIEKTRTKSDILPSDSTGIVVSEWLNVRPIPDINAKSIFILKKGTHVQVLEDHGKWLKVLCKDKIGYIRNRGRYIQIMPHHSKKISLPPLEPITKEKKISGTTRAKSVTQIKTKPDLIELEDKKHIITELHKHESQIVKFTEEEKAIIQNLNLIDVSLNNARKNTNKTRTTLKNIQKEVNQTDLKLDNLRTTIKTNESYISKRLVAIHKLQNIGNLRFLASADTIYEFFKRKAAMDKILHADAAVFDAHLKNLETLLQLKNKNIHKQKQLFRLDAELKTKIKTISNEKKKRSVLLNNIQNKKILTLAAIDSLRQSALKIERHILSIGHKFLPNNKTYTCSFTKNGMILPVSGKIISRFGQGIKNIFNFKTFQNGIDIKSERGEPILAICNGKVIFSSWLQGYGNLIIIDHGDNYHTVYAHAEELFKNEGEAVESGEVIATVGESGSGTGGPMLYFEIRHKGKPLDPLIWLNQS